MGIADSKVNENFFSQYLGMRCEHADMCEIDRRVKKGIYDRKEYERAIAWVREYCREGQDYNSRELAHSRAEKDAVWEYNVKMTMIIRDMMVDNEVLRESGFDEEANGHNAIASGFQGHLTVMQQLYPQTYTAF